jgi:hypothetical protein
MMHVLDVESCMALRTVKTDLTNPRAFAPLPRLKLVVLE